MTVRTTPDRFGGTAYLRTPTGASQGGGLIVLTLAGDRICAMTRFDHSVLSWFALPPSRPAGKPGGAALARDGR